MLRIEDFTPTCVDEAHAIARENYAEARKIAPALPDVDPPALTEFIGSTSGVAAFDGATMVGYLLGCDPWENVHGSTARGTFSPLEANGARGSERGRIYMRMYQAAAEKWVARGIGYHAICLYAYDRAAIDAMFAYGFGQRCADAIRPMEPIACGTPCDLAIVELTGSEREAAMPLRERLFAHMGESPTFMRDTPERALAYMQGASRRAERVFAAVADGKPVAFLDISRSGEAFPSTADDVRNITGAYCLPSHRGRALIVRLMNRTIAEYAAQGVRSLGVDYESINPTAYAFWGKHFTPYTMSVARRIDCV